jgi:hypothetical protein
MWPFVLGLLETAARKAVGALADHWRPLLTHAGAAALGAGAILWMRPAPTPTETVPAVPTIEPSGPESVIVSEERTQIDTTCSALPESFGAPLDSTGNGLPKITYRIPDGPPPWLAVEVSGRRPAVGVGPEQVRLQGADPRTGQMRQYAYEVPDRPFFLEGSVSAALPSREVRTGITGGWKVLEVGVSAAPLSGRPLGETLSTHVALTYSLRFDL